MSKLFVHTLAGRMTVGALTLFLAYNLSAKGSDNFVADQPVVCPPAAIVPSDETVADAEQSDEVSTPAQSSSAPIKSGRSTRPKWKALLPGTIK